MRIRLAFAGLVLVVGITLPLLWMTRPGSRAILPGLIEAKQPMLHWQCPEPATGPSSSLSTPTFELVNSSGSPVHIKSVRTNCGCATAQAEPEIVPPGGRSVVRVGVDSLEVGSRAATITLETDSPATPQVILTVVAEGYRRPPYLFKIEGDLYYHEGYSAEETRNVVVEAVTLKETAPQPPALACDPPLVEFGSPAITDRPYAANPEMLVRRYTYAVQFAKPPPNEGFTAEVSVADPWVPGRALRARLVGEPNRPIRVVPSLLVLNVTEGGVAPTPVRFFARANRDGVSLRSVAVGDDNPLVVEADVKADDSQFAAFLVNWKPGQKVRAGTYHIIVTSDADGSGSLTVPVQVRIREG